jgi:hypothetical protein
LGKKKNEGKMDLEKVPKEIYLGGTYRRYLTDAIPGILFFLPIYFPGLGVEFQNKFFVASLIAFVLIISTSVGIVLNMYGVLRKPLDKC